jgi:hypothetical protein
MLSAIGASTASVSGQASGVITARDAVIDQSQQSVPLGSERYMTVGGPQPLGEDTRSLIRFDVTGYPSAIAVSEAVVYLYQVNAQSYRINVHRVTEPWDEKTATWRTRDGVTPWSNANGGGTFDSATVVGSFAANAIGWRAVAIEPGLVQDWLSGAEPNHGLVLDAPGDQVFLPVRFETREAMNQPQLHIRYTVVSPDSSSNGFKHH